VVTKLEQTGAGGASTMSESHNVPVVSVNISVVVPCLNAAGTLERQLTALENQTVLPWEVIVSDNGSTDESLAIARRFAARSARFKSIVANKKRGASHARNAGARVASGDVVAFCDADDVVAPEWIAGLAVALQTHDFVASRFDHSKLNPPSKWVHPQAHGLIQETAFDFLPRAGACGLAIRKRLHDTVGGFDESLRYHEDTDYCWRVQLAGVPLGYAPEAVVHIQNRTTSRARFQQARHWGASEMRLYRRYRKHGAGKSASAIDDWIRIGRLAVRSARSGHVLPDLVWRLGTRLGHLQGTLMSLILLPW
jgi:glycosyltransferase involved in cell wall biosynthesis